MRKLICIVCLLLPVIAVAKEEVEKPKVYRWVEKDGSVVFSTNPPKGIDAQEVKLGEPAAVVPSQRPTRNYRGDGGGDSVGQLRAKRADVKSKISELEERLEKLRSDHAAGEEPRENERQRLNSGGLRLKEDYFQRREREQRQIEALEEKLDELWAEFNRLR